MIIYNCYHCFWLELNKANIERKPFNPLFDVSIWKCRKKGRIVRKSWFACEWFVNASVTVTEIRLSDEQSSLILQK